MVPSGKASRIKELLVISGKGGTGKTTVLGSFAALSQQAVLVDCDVDAANLYLLLDPDITGTVDFHGLPQPRTVQEKCRSCSVCTEVCRFGAIQSGRIDYYACECCGVCIRACPHGAIVFAQVVRGQWFTANTQYGPLVYARLHPGEENSGLLVAEVKKRAREVAKETNRHIILTDGPPGIGCPVISSLAAVDLVLIVTEPTVSGWHDLQRTIELTQRFQTHLVVCINKYDICIDLTNEITDQCRAAGMRVIGRIPFDEKVAAAMSAGKPVVGSSGKAATAIRGLWSQVSAELQAIE